MNKQIVLGILAVLLLASFAPLAPPNPHFSGENVEDNASGIERIQLTPDPDSVGDAHPSASWDGEERLRPTTVDTHLGQFTEFGFESDVEVPEILTEIRTDIVMVVVHGDVGLWDARVALTALPGIEVRAHIPPSGFLLQGHPVALAATTQLDFVAAVHPLPLAFMIDYHVSDLLADAANLESPNLLSTAVQLNGWRESSSGTPQDHVRLGHLSGDLDQTAEQMLTNHRPIQSGRHLGIIPLSEIANIAAEPALAWISLEPVWELDNNEAIGHMRADDVSNYFPNIGLNGSGHSVTVADSGIDRDHGDFDGRIEHVESVIWGDSSTEDVHSGHGTHVACTVLGNGSHGSYAGVAPQATLRFQAMEDDDSGNFGGVSMDTLIRKAYEANSHIHTNSWGAHEYYGEYTTSSEDADSRTNTYDRFWSYDGMIVLVSAGNDGPNSDTITPPATAKNVVAVGNHHNRGGGAPDTLSDGSSRGPTDDGRIKPDVTAPGSWVRSCRSQDADDIGGASWSSQWYLEYSGTSMAAPNAAGASVLIREYLMEVAGRPAPQGALIKGLLILGAEDAGTRDIPNMNEGWGRVNLANSLIPGTDTGIWVDDRTTVRSGQSREYQFNLSRSNTPFKVVLTWSDYPGSTWSSKQLQNDLDMVVTAPDGTEYLGNDFASGRSTTGGDADDTNNVEVVLVDQADIGVWTVRITDVAHGGQSSDQPFALAVRGAGVNDLRSDPMPVAASFQLSTDIPQVNDVCQITIQIQNQGGGRANPLYVEAIAGGQNLGDVELDLGPGMSRWATWDWTPTSEGQKSILIRIDPNDDFEEIDEDNNMFETLVGVSAPGVRVTADATTKTLEDSSATSTSWDFSIRNTALIPTNASIASSTPIKISSGQAMTTWFTSFTQTTFELEGSESADIGFTLVHDSPPDPGLYQFTITAHDDDNDIDFPLTVALRVNVLPGVSFQAPFQTLQVHPSEPTRFTVDVHNDGNGNQGYNLYLESPIGWWVGLDSLGTTTDSASGSTGAIPVDGARTVDMTLVPPAGTPPTAGLSLTANLRVISQVDPDQYWVYPIQFEVIEFESGQIEIESEMMTLQPDSTTYIQFTVTNIGNAPLTLYPNLDDRPGGWSVTMGTQTLEVPIGDSVPYVVGLEGNGFALGGEINVHLSTLSGYRITWNGQLNVAEEAKPVVAFCELCNSYDFHPTGEPGFLLSWVIGNDGSAAWSPSISFDFPDNSWSGSCDQIGEINGGQSTEVSCIIVAPVLAPAGPTDVALVVNAEGVERTSHTTLTIAANPAILWRTLSIDESMEGKTSDIYLEVENIGNVPVQDRLILETPRGWDAEVEGTDLVSLSVGATQGIRISIVPDAGEDTLSLDLEQGSTVEGSSYSITMDVPNDPTLVRESDSAIETIAIIGLIVFIIAGLALATVLVIRLRQPPPSQAPIASAFVPQVVQQPIAVAPAVTPQVTPQTNLQEVPQNGE
jgi:uncharacterized membrane protein